jgi:D-psicose/D-tagatose/L-ribulose 3-epimerase
MRFGVCVSGAEQVKILAEVGYDFCELPARAVQPFEDEATALPVLRALAAMPLRSEAFNILVPASLPLVGPKADLTALQSYLRTTFTRMAQVGGEVVVLGSGAARRIPDDMPRAEALDQLTSALQLAADEAGRVGIALALEHLNKGESNVFTTLAESQQFIEERGIGGLRLLADLHHLELEHEPLTNVVQAAPYLAHVHVADGGRGAPGIGGYDYTGFMAVLRQIGYDRRISAECKWEDLGAQAGDALAFMRAQWAM